MKNSSTLLIVGIVVLVFYLWYQTNKPAATTTTKSAINPQATSANTANTLANLLKNLLGTGKQAPAAPKGGSGLGSGAGTAGGANLSQKPPTPPPTPTPTPSPNSDLVDNGNGTFTSQSTGLVYQNDPVNGMQVIGQNGQTGLAIGMDSQGNTVFLGQDGDYVNSEGSSIPATEVTWYDAGAGITSGPQQDTSGTDSVVDSLVSTYDLSGDGSSEDDWG